MNLQKRDRANLSAKLGAASPFRPFPLEEYEARWTRVHDAMRRKGYKMAVVWGKTSGVYERAGDTLYLTNFFSTHSGQEPDTVLWNARSFCAILLEDGQIPELFTDEADPRLDIIATDRFNGSYDPVKGLADALKQRKVSGKIALVGSDTLPFKYGLQLRDATPGIEWVFEDDLVRDTRLIKSERELALFREAGELVTRAETAMMEALIRGETEAAAAGTAGKILLEAGGGWHRIAISHGAFSQFLESDPTRGFSRLAPRPGDIAHGFIYGPILKGYWLDPGRTVVCGGRPTDRQRRLVESLVDVMNQLMAAVRPGVKVKDVALLGDKLSAESGYANEVLKTAWPYYGHSNGCMWEKPYIESRLCSDDEVFVENMVASVEGFFTDAEAGTAAFETNYIVTRTGIEEITPVPHLFW